MNIQQQKNIDIDSPVSAVHAATQSHKRPDFHAYYDFEKTISYWEGQFNLYANSSVPAHEQALLLSDLLWMLKSDAPLPYHYPVDTVQAAKARVISLLERIDDEVILSFPEIDPFHAHFLISLKRTNEIHTVVESGGYKLYNHTHLISQEDHVEIHITHCRLLDSHLHLTGHICSVLFNYIEKPSLIVCSNNGSQHLEELPLTFSSWSYHRAKIATNCFWLFDCDINLKNTSSYSFSVKTASGLCLNTVLSYDWQTPFSKTDGENFIAIIGRYVLHSKMGEVIIRPLHYRDRLIQHIRFWKKPKVWASRQLSLLSVPKYDGCWLYYDCKGHQRDNGYFQFIQKIQKKDGIPRFYVINEDDFTTSKRAYPLDVQDQIVEFGSFRHKLLYLRAEKILTAFVELENYFPFGNGTFGFYKDICSQHELVYLQHGVLHAHTPWKYSRDRLNIDKEVVSSPFEKDNLTRTYGFRTDDLICCGMPRYDYISCNCSEQHHILYAPSWRKYTLSFSKGQWVPSVDDFLNSGFYKDTQRFLDSSELHSILEEYNCQLDFKLHPIMKCYRHLYHTSNSRIHIIDAETDPSSYSLFISDFSSYVFDFVYQKIPIIYFFPDEELFRGGMNSYRELDLSYDDAFGPLVHELSELINAVRVILKNNCQPSHEYLERMNQFFFYYDNNQCERLYEHLMHIEKLQ